MSKADLSSSLFRFDTTALKICGVTCRSDAERLVELGVHALGINFYPKSKRACSPADASTFLPAIAGQILRVGVFVNNAAKLAPDLLAKGLIDVIQLHGDEDQEELRILLATGATVIRSLPLPSLDEEDALIANYLDVEATSPGRFALLLDAHAPGVYGGTGQTIDWERARHFVEKAKPLPVLLAGGITPENAADAIAQTRPAGIDIASGAESAPGIKDFEKVKALLAATAP